MERAVWSHLREAGYRCSYRVFSGFLRGVVVFYYGRWWCAQLLRPLGGNAIYLSLWGSYWRRLRLGLVVGLSIFWLVSCLQWWAFVAPGRRRGEQIHLRLLLCLRWVGAIGALLLWWNLLLPRVCYFFSPVEGPLSYLPEVGTYVELALGLLWALFLGRQLPPLLLWGVLSGLWSVRGLTGVRRWLHLGLWVVATLLRPPDVGSQLLLVIPLLVWLEVSICLSCWLEVIEEEGDSRKDKNR